MTKINCDAFDTTHSPIFTGTVLEGPIHHSWRQWGAGILLSRTIIHSIERPWKKRGGSSRLPTIYHRKLIVWIGTRSGVDTLRKRLDLEHRRTIHGNRLSQNMRN